MKKASVITCFMLIMTGFSSCIILQQAETKNRHTSPLEEFQREYPFAKHKGIFPDTIHSGQNSDRSSTKLLKDYISQIPDPWVRCNPEDYPLWHFGFFFFPLPDSGFFIPWVQKDSKVWKAGMRPGDKLIAWNGKEIEKCLDEIESFHHKISYNLRAKKTLKCIELQTSSHQESSEIYFQNQEGGLRGIKVSAEGMLSQNSPLCIFSGPSEKETSEMYHQESFSYIRIKNFSHYSSKLASKFFNQVRKRNTNYIIDMRNCSSVKQKNRNKILKSFIKNLSDSPLHGLILISPLCKGSPELLAYQLQKREQIKVLGMFESAGAYTASLHKQKINSNLSIEYPTKSASHDEKLHLVSNMYGIGGVIPDIIPEMNQDALLRIFQGEDILLKQAIWILTRGD